MQLMNIITHKSKYTCLSILITATFLLSACQQSKKQDNLTLSEQAQLKMLVSVIAGSKVLKTQCQKIDIPNDDKLIKAAVESAKAKGWNTKAYASTANGSLSQLQLASENVFRQLSTELINDPEGLALKCDELNGMLTSFINKANQA